jgi:16S rRNA (cytosine967-C5)-methyltransferase
MGCDDINLRHIILKILEEVYEGNTFINDSIEHYFNTNDLNKQEKSFIKKVTYGTVENGIKLDYILNQFSKVKTNKLKKPILYILRMSVYQLLYMDSIPDSAVCNEAVKLVKKRRMVNLTGFVNGVLRNISRNKLEIKLPTEAEKEDYLSIRYSYDKWLIQFLLKQYDYETLKLICEDSIETPKITIRQNTLKCSKEALLKSLEAEEITVKNTVLPYAFTLHNISDIGQITAFQKGYFQVQDLSSMFVAEIAAPTADMEVLDTCAAPGGKTTHLAMLMHNKGKIYSRDVSEKKITLIRENCNRLGINNCSISTQDATVLDKDLIDKMDIVLTDVPCSALGVIKKRPDIKLNASIDRINSLIEVQRKILETSCLYVKKGGLLIYSTCTINKMENIQNINWFLKEHHQFILEAIEMPYKTENMVSEEGHLSFLPINDITDGFFVAKLRRMT